MDKIDTNNALFTNYVFKSIPLAFDESMSYYEFLSAILSYLKDTIVTKMNEIITEQTTIEGKISGYDTRMGEIEVRLSEIEEVINTFKPYTDAKVEALRTEILTIIDDIKSTYLKKTDLTPQLLQTKIEGSDDVIVDVNETDDKLQVRLDDDVRNNVSNNPTLSLEQTTGDDVKIKDTYLNLKGESKSSEISLNQKDFKKVDNKLRLNLQAGTNIVINEDNVISAIQGGEVATDYSIITNKPKLNNVILVDNVTLDSINVYDKDTIDNDLSSIQLNIDNEITNRRNADTNLQTNITTEQNARVDADSGLKTDLTTETNAREVADIELNTKISNEATTRANADTNLQTNINKEASTRANADTTLQENIDKKQDTLVSGTNIKSIDGQSLVGSGSIYSKVNMHLIWTNSDTSVDFAQQSLSLNLSNYKFLYIVFRRYITYPLNESNITCLIRNGSGGYALGMDDGKLIGRSIVGCNNSAITFGAGIGEDASVNNSYCIPYLIYGLESEVE